MKKFLVILLTLFYGASATGMTLHLHYCCGEFQNIELVPVHNNDCHEEEASDCCESKLLRLEIEEDQSLVPNYSIDYQSHSIPYVNSWIDPASLNSGKRDFNFFNSPPLTKELNQLFCVFRI